jgi:hypothetical protein
VAKIVSKSFKKKAIVILDGYHFCSASKKKLIHNNGFVWCEGNSKCKNSSCSTRLFSRDKDAPQNEPDSWEFESKPNIKIRIKDARVYCVFCVDEIKI